MRDVTITIGGVSYRLTSLSARQVQEFLDYAKKTLSDPVAELLDAAALLPEGKVKDDFLTKHLDAAFDRKRLRGTLSDPDLADFQQSLAGARKAGALMFRKYHPSLTEDEVFDLLGQLADDPEAQATLGGLRGESTRVPLTEDDAERRSFRGPRAVRRKIPPAREHA
jgi:hypothetical protein